MLMHLKCFNKESILIVHIIYTSASKLDYITCKTVQIIWALVGVNANLKTIFFVWIIIPYLKLYKIFESTILDCDKCGRQILCYIGFTKLFFSLF